MSEYHQPESERPGRAAGHLPESFGYP